MKKTLVVYTVALGGDYDLPPVIGDDDVDHVCFTDQVVRDGSGWIIENISPLIPSDTFRSSRDFKIRPHIWLKGYENSIYIDSTVHLLKEPIELWKYLIPNQSVAFGGFFHSFRETVADEFAAVSKSRLDYSEVLGAQMQAYQKFHPSTMLEKPVWGGILARRHNDPSCAKAMEVWFANVLRYSRRDQLSLPLSLSNLESAEKNIVSLDLRESEFHRWPISSKPKPPGYVVPEGDDVDKVITKYQDFSNMKKIKRRIKKYFSRIRKKPSVKSMTDSSVLSGVKAQNVSFMFDEELNLHFVKDKNWSNPIYVSDERRLELYREGVKHRQAWILRDYRLPNDLIRKGDVVIDVGANVGEIGLWVAMNGGDYMGFEPDPIAYRALQKNMHGSALYDVALSDKNGVSKFYLNTAEADSSLFYEGQSDDSADVISVRTVTLDTFLAEIGSCSKIRLLKVEAEGMEPEVLAGSTKTLNKVEYVAVDAGPERGGENTVPDTFNILAASGFELLDCFLGRGTFLFRNSRLSK